MAVETGRIYPYSYRNLQEPDEYLADLLREFGRRVWLLDIRFDPEGDTHFPQYRGEWLKEVRGKQYRHAKGLGLVNDQLYYPGSAICKLLEMLSQRESFVLFSDKWKHAKMVEQLVRTHAKGQHIALENPYAIEPGDLCLLVEEQVEVVVCTRQSDIYTFYTDSRDPNVRTAYGLPVGGLVDLRDLQLLQSRLYLCAKCGRGDVTTIWREKAQKLLCGHCSWLSQLDNGEEEN